MTIRGMITNAPSGKTCQPFITAARLPGFLGGLFPTPLYHLGGLFPTPLYHLHPCRRASMQASFHWNDY